MVTLNQLIEWKKKAVNINEVIVFTSRSFRKGTIPYQSEWGVCYNHELGNWLGSIGIEVLDEYDENLVLTDGEMVVELRVKENEESLKTSVEKEVWLDFNTIEVIVEKMCYSGSVLEAYKES